MNLAAGNGEQKNDEKGKKPWGLTIPDHKDIIVGELAERGEWIVANIHTASFWPVNAQKVMYRGAAFWIIPLMKGFYPAVAMRVPHGKTRLECETLVMRFVSNLSWVEGQGFLVDGIGGGSLPMPMGWDKERGFSICEEFDLSYFPEPASDRALIALALMREGRGLNHPAYSFLSFFRVLEVAFPNGKARERWVSANVGSLGGHRVPEALAALRGKGIIDIGAHLYQSGRCAIAHADRTPIIDPDDPSDMRRMQSELPIMIALAQKAIEEELGVETSHTVYRKHLYELEGFKRVLGPDTVAHLARGEQITDGRMVSFPDISVRIRRRDPYAPLSGLAAQEISQNGTVLHIRFASKNGSAAIRFRLDFGAERPNFSTFDDVYSRDTGTPESADAVAEIRRFQSEYFGNGQLHIVDTDTNDLIARKDAYIPMNMFLDQRRPTAKSRAGDGWQKNGAAAIGDLRKRWSAFQFLTRQSSCNPLPTVRTLLSRCPRGSKSVTHGTRTRLRDRPEEGSQPSCKSTA